MKFSVEEIRCPECNTVVLTTNTVSAEPKNDVINLSCLMTCPKCGELVRIS
jgi:uncharacterized protein with PIN domain